MSQFKLTGNSAVFFKDIVESREGRQFIQTELDAAKKGYQQVSLRLNELYNNPYSANFFENEIGLNQLKSDYQDTILQLNQALQTKTIENSIF